MSVITISKQLGETMGELLIRVRREHDIDSSVSVTYVGRLDPAATGWCTFLSGDDVHRKDEFLGTDKEYVAEIAVGIATDTDDLLGVLLPATIENQTKDMKNFSEALNNLVGPLEQSPHPFSGFRVNGQALWVHTRRGGAAPAPVKVRTVYSAHMGDMRTIPGSDIAKRMEYIVGAVTGDFRQDIIADSWKSFNTDRDYVIITVMFSVSSGTFIRGLVRTLSEGLEIPMVLYSLERTRVRHID